ncbi:sulfite exporter TauE/SafE family protein [Thaumasiovibrio subtropicus]|uniref:sulfite exporter TauE/SafE family protein n=1 Tax=Thaumasiovibrio subtropicus TaxID=1891207 RepID=UPI000B359B20|nr:sulfite exporter TauE/SafE family protein [Thaumasiovibrio subtropicus]
MDIFSLLFSLDTLLKLGFGTLIGLCLGLTGVGGGVLIIPVLTVFFGMQTIMAVGTASLISSIVKVNAGFAHIKAGNVAWRPLRWMLLGAIPMTLATTSGILLLNQHQVWGPRVALAVEATIVGVMVFALISIFRKYRTATKPQTEVSRSTSTAVMSGMACGSILGSTGVGGGVMLLPAFNTVMGVDIKKSIGSSVVMALVLSALTALNYGRGGQSDMLAAIVMSLGAFIGVPIAVRLLKKLSDSQIYLFTLVIISISLALTLLH